MLSQRVYKIKTNISVVIWEQQQDLHELEQHVGGCDDQWHGDVGLVAAANLVLLGPRGQGLGQT